MSETVPGHAELVEEGLGILTNLMDNIQRKGNYSAESTVVFLDQIGQCLRAALRPDQGEAFKPCITVNEEAGIVEFTAEDVAYIAEPLFPGVYHYIDKHVAMDDRRVVGMATWSATPRVAKSIDLEERLEAAEAEAARLKDENKELGAALKPFAAYIKARDDGDGDIPDDAPAFSYAPDLRGDNVVTVRFADLRRARTLIAAKGGWMPLPTAPSVEEKLP